MTPIPPAERAWVERCLAILELDPETRDDQGGPHGQPTGHMRPELGPNIQDLTCTRCNAGWAGIPGDPCCWCQHREQLQLEHQAELTLTPPDIDVDDILFDTRMQGWLARLKHAVETDVITQQQALAAWRNAHRKAAA